MLFFSDSIAGNTRYVYCGVSSCIFSNVCVQEAKEGPVTKHIRLTSALILRNLARYSSHGRRSDMLQGVQSLKGYI